jgi:hypothetical protein
MKCYMGNMIPQQNIKRIEHTKLKEVSLIWLQIGIIRL